MTNLLRWAGAMALALMIASTPASAQSDANKYAGQDVSLRSAVTGQTIGDDPSRPLYVTGGGGGGGGSVPTGTAGSPTPSVVSVQGVAGGTSVPVSNASLASIDAKLPAIGPKAASGSLSIAPATDASFDTVIRSTATDRGASVGTTSVQLMPANSARRGFSIQVQSASASCYISGLATATADFHSLQIAANAYYETPGTHVATGAVNIICTAAATPVYAREW